MNEEFIGAIRELVREKGINEDLLFTTVENALEVAYKKNYQGTTSMTERVRVSLNRVNGETHVYSLKSVVDEVFDEANEMTLEEARELSARYEVGDTVEIEVTPKSFGRVAAQSAKQVVIQRIKEAERENIYNEFIKKEFDIITGVVIRREKNKVLISLDKTEAILEPSEQMPGEEYTFNEKLKLYIVEVKNTAKGPQIIISRTHPGLVKRLFELEVPEIYDGTVEIKSISREAGARTKIAVHSQDAEVDPMGACVGPQGARVQSVVRELKNEKIDIIKWSKTPEVYIANSLSPAKVLDVVVDEEAKSAKVIVDNSQLSLAIGKEGQNVRLAAKLTGWKIDIKSSSQVE